MRTHPLVLGLFVFTTLAAVYIGAWGACTGGGAHLVNGRCLDVEVLGVCTWDGSVYVSNFRNNETKWWELLNYTEVLDDE
jgi:hypothetical protein